MKIMNILKCGLLLSLVLNVGCASVYNHGRVKQKVIRDRIIATGNKEQLNLLSLGLKPSEVVNVSRPPDGSQGVMMSVNLADIRSLNSYFTTYGEAPISSTVAALLDVGTTILVGKEVFDGGSDDKESYDGIQINITGNDNNTGVNTGNGNTTVTSDDDTVATTGEGSAAAGDNKDADDTDSGN